MYNILPTTPLNTSISPQSSTPATLKPASNTNPSNFLYSNALTNPFNPYTDKLGQNTATPSKTPAVLTSSTAKKDLNKKVSDVAVIEQGMANQAAKNVATAEPVKTAEEISKQLTTPTTGEKDYSYLIEDTGDPNSPYAQQLAGARTDAEREAIAKKLGADRAVELGLEKAPDPYTAELQKGLADLEKTTNDYVNQLKTGVFELTPEQQAQIDATVQKFQQLKRQQEDYNYRYTQGTTVYEQVRGRSEYASRLAMGNIQESINVGMGKLAEIDAQMAATISEMKSAFASDNIKAANAAYTAMNDFIKQKNATLKEIHDNVAAEAAALAAENKATREEEAATITSLSDLVGNNIAAGMSDEDLKKMIDDMSVMYGVDPNKLISSAVKASISFQKDNMPEGDVGQYIQALQNGVIPAGTSYADFLNIGKTNEAPTTKEINGKTMEWDASTGTWTEPTGVGQNWDEAIVAGNRTIIYLTKDLLSDSTRLAMLTGPIQGRLPALTGEGQDFVDKVNQLINIKASLNLDKLKGPMSDKDIQFLKLIETSLNRLKGTEQFKDELKNILSVSVKGALGSGDDIDLNTFYMAMPEETQKAMVDYKEKNPDVSDEEIISEFIPQQWLDDWEKEGLSFNQVGGDTKLATIASIPNNSKGGQCGHFVNQLTGLNLGDSYASKLAMMDRSIKKPQAGMVFVMPVQGSRYGHTGIILAINPDGTATVKDSNWFEDSKPEKVATHKIPINQMTGFTYA